MENTKIFDLEEEKRNFKELMSQIEESRNITILLAYVRGSHMYGTNTEKSDVDITFVYKQPTEEILKGRHRPQIKIGGDDVVGYEIQEYIDLLAKNNPNMLESLDIPEDCLIYKHESMDIFMDQSVWLTKITRNSILGYAQSQVKKATGLNKNMNNPQPEERNTILHYCYIIEREKSIPFLEWYDTYCSYHKGLEEKYLDYNNWGLIKVPNGKGIFALFLNELNGDDFRGLIKDNDSTQLRLSEIPKLNYELRKEVYTLYYNLDGFEVHCKQHKAYWEWVKERNEERFKLNQQAGQNIDLKNMSHLFRLLEMALNISLGKGLHVRTENVQYLRDIRAGKYKYDDLMLEAERLTEEIKGNYESVELPEEVNMDKVKDILLTFRIQ